MPLMSPLKQLPSLTPASVILERDSREAGVLKRTQRQNSLHQHLYPSPAPLSSPRSPPQAETTESPSKVPALSL